MELPQGQCQRQLGGEGGIFGNSCNKQRPPPGLLKHKKGKAASRGKKETNVSTEAGQEGCCLTWASFLWSHSLFPSSGQAATRCSILAAMSPGCSSSGTRRLAGISSTPDSPPAPSPHLKAPAPKSCCLPALPAERGCFRALNGPFRLGVQMHFYICMEKSTGALLAVREWFLN
jgi:hypothetical protein